jgi:hypothetical protein
MDVQLTEIAPNTDDAPDVDDVGPTNSVTIIDEKPNVTDAGAFSMLERVVAKLAAHCGFEGKL